MIEHKYDINNADDMHRVLKDRKKQAKDRKVNEKNTKNETPKADHRIMANLVLKCISVMRVDPIIKRVLSMRVMGPMMTGQERSHLSIALEIGTTVDEVMEIERAGLHILDDFLQRVNSPEFVAKFNREKKIQKEISLIQTGKS